MHIDDATIADLDELVAVSKPMFDEMGFEEYGNAWQLDSMIEWWTAVLTDRMYEIVVARDNGAIVGVSVICYVNKFFWHKGSLQACELAHHALPLLPTVTRCRIMIKMLDAMVAKFKVRGAEYFKIGYDPKPQFKAWGDYLRKRGFIDSSHVLVAKVGAL